MMPIFFPCSVAVLIASTNPVSGTGRRSSRMGRIGDQMSPGSFLPTTSRITALSIALRVIGPMTSRSGASGMILFTEIEPPLTL
jgi:hypothetical protein